MRISWIRSQAVVLFTHAGLSLVLVGMEGCSGQPDRTAAASSSAPTERPESVPLAPVPSLAEGATLSIDEVIAIARARTPTRAVFDADQRLARALVTQAEAWANPELELEGGRARATDGEHLSIGRVAVRQRFELPDKRSRRIDAARSQQAVAASEADALLIDLDSSVREAATTVGVLQLAVPDGEAAALLAHQVADAVQRRLDGGEATRSDLLRAQVDALQADQERDLRRRSLQAARSALTALCGGGLPTTFSVTADLDTLPEISLEQAQTAAQTQNPRLRRLDAIIEQRRREVRREQSAADPDLTLGVFTGKETDSRNVGVSVGVEVPVWNRNQGGIAQARAQLDRDEAEQTVQRQSLAAEVQAAWYDYDSAKQRVRSFAESLSPSAHEALALALHAYEAGESGLLDVLDARRTAQSVERDHLEAVKNAQLARIRLDRAIGRTVEAHP